VPPIIDVVPASNFVGQWPKAFIQAGRRLLVELDSLPPARALAISEALAASEAAPHTLTQQRGILAPRSPALLHSRGRPSHLHKGPRKCSAFPAHPRLRRGYRTERGGPPPLLGLSPGLCGLGRTVAYLMHRTVWSRPLTRKSLLFVSETEGLPDNSPADFGEGG
jgi:hypothetical protein